jgi:hypothetical protein
VCERPVERVDDLSNHLTGEIVLMAHCHGAHEVTRFPMTALVGDNVPVFGEAFKSPAALPPRL